MTDHKQIPVWNGERMIQIDVNLAELLYWIFTLGIKTLNSCEENRPGIAWIQFANSENFKRFMNLVAQYPKKDEVYWKTLYGRMMSYSEDDNWEYDMRPINYGVNEELIGDEVIETFLGYHDFEMWVSVRFPITDIELLVKILKNSPDLE